SSQYWTTSPATRQRSYGSAAERESSPAAARLRRARFDRVGRLSDNMPVPRPPTTTRSKPSAKALVARMEKSGPSRAKLRRLARRHPAPQEWLDQDQSRGANGRKKRG